MNWVKLEHLPRLLCRVYYCLVWHVLLLECFLKVQFLPVDEEVQLGPIALKALYLISDVDVNLLAGPVIEVEAE